MRVKLMGISDINYKKRDGSGIVDAYTLYFCYSEPGIDGLATGEVYLSKDDERLTIDPAEFLDSEIDVEYNGKGRLVSISA